MKRLLLLLLLAPAFFFSPASAQAQNPTVVDLSVTRHCKEFEKFIFLRKGQQFDLKNHQILKKPR